jgi:hypothetical protein
MFKTLEKILIAVLDIVAPQPPKPAPPPPPPPAPEPIDPKTAAKEMRETAKQLNALADRLDPFTLPFPTLPKIPPKWNTFVDDDGTTGGLIKRKGSGVEMMHETIVDPDVEETAELLEHIHRGGLCCGKHK